MFCIKTKNVNNLAKKPIVGGVPNIEAKVIINSSLIPAVLLFLWNAYSDGVELAGELVAIKIIK